MKKVFILILLAPLLVCLSCGNMRKAEDYVPPEDLCADIQIIQRKISQSLMRDLYSPEPFEQIKKSVMKGKMGRLDCVFKIKEILCSYHISHLNLVPNDDDPTSFICMPFGLLRFGDEYRVIYATEPYLGFLDRKVVELGGLPIEEALEKYNAFSSYETECGAKYFLEGYLSLPRLKHAGLVDSNDEISITLETPDGDRMTQTYPFVDYRDDPLFYNVWGDGYPYDIYFSYENYSLKKNPAKRMIYIPYTSCYEISEYTMADLFSDLLGELRTGLYDTVVFDVRRNSGGDMYLRRKILYEFRCCKDELEKYNIAIVAGGRTYSAACWFMNDLLQYFPHAKIFGEETGQAVFNYTNVIPLELDNLKCDFSCPRAKDNIPVLRERCEDIHRGVMPDFEVHEDFREFQKGNDAIYDAIYNFFETYKG